MPKDQVPGSSSKSRGTKRAPTRASLRSDQGRDGVPPLPTAWTAEGGQRVGHRLHVPQSPESLPSPPTIGCPDVARRRCGGAAEAPAPRSARTAGRGASHRTTRSARAPRATAPGGLSERTMLHPLKQAFARATDPPSSCRRAGDARRLERARGTRNAPSCEIRRGTFHHRRKRRPMWSRCGCRRIDARCEPQAEACGDDAARGGCHASPRALDVMTERELLRGSVVQRTTQADSRPCAFLTSGETQRSLGPHAFSST